MLNKEFEFCIMSMTLFEINNMILEEKIEGLKIYNRYINEFKKDPVMRNFIDTRLSIYEMLENCENCINVNKSDYLFTGDTVKFYPSKKTLKASKPTLCSFSGSIIKPGSEYIFYRPLLHNLTDNKKYVLSKTMKVETTYSDLLPDTLEEFENMIYNLDYAEPGSFINSVDYYSIAANIKNWSLKELGKSKTKTKKVFNEI